VEVPQAKKVKLGGRDEKVLKALTSIVDNGTRALVAWYNECKAVKLKEEVERRGLRPVPSKKADMMQVLVRDDLRLRGCESLQTPLLE
jgi:hypothetical protein